DVKSGLLSVIHRMTVENPERTAADTPAMESPAEDNDGVEVDELYGIRSNEICMSSRPWPIIEKPLYGADCSLSKPIPPMSARSPARPTTEGNMPIEHTERLRSSEIFVVESVPSRSSAAASLGWNIVSRS